MKKDAFTRLIQAADFRSLFNELGWDHKPLARTLIAGENPYSLQAVAEKRDFYVLQCSPDTNGKIPDQIARRAISRQFEKVKNYHVIIFANRDGSEQVWQFVLRLPNRPPKFVETHWQRGQDVELLYQKVRGLFFDLDEEGNITIVDVLTRVQKAAGANAEKTAKEFYDGFKKEHSAFLGFIKGIQAQGDQEWYASLMLNRLMFCYFIQKKGFLDNNPQYLSDKLRQVREQQGKGVFYNFYRQFLLVLFYEGLNKTGDKPALIGEVPYLNGGLFDVHELELRYLEISIPDEAFERIFAFFDRFQWHLDNRPGRTGKEINPDVIGYIFEKYINDRAGMGAYYTKEDITDYISKNCIIPFLFEEAERKGSRLKSAFQLLAADPDRYIYPAVRHGITFDYRRNEPLDQPFPLPEDVAAGLDTEQPNLPERRKCWNREAPPEAGLPTEWWRETVERRQRYQDLRAKMTGGEVQNINDLITLNLDIRGFAQDALRASDDPQFIRHFFAALERLSVLDPTCGSGAFLFAALNILEPLYEICLDRMADFVDSLPVGEGRAGAFKDFEKILADANDPDRHPNRDYFIYKRIIVHNLFGVDIMREAVEIAKLRLFLKLMSTVEADRRRPNLGLEPLPDVDFNIRAGNALVGFATLEEARDAIQQRDAPKNGQLGLGLVFEEELQVVRAVEEKAELVAKAYARFQDDHVVNDQGSDAHHRAKQELRARLADLNDSLNVYNAFLYGIERDNNRKGYDDWLASHQPFHWFAEFFGMLYDAEGKFKGFDCVIGNPPYVQNSEIKYSLRGFSTAKCGNLYPIVMERVFSIVKAHAYKGFIVPVSSVSTDGYAPLQQLLSDYDLVYSSFDDRPSRLFDGLEHIRLTIHLIGKKRNDNIFHASKYHKWNAVERSFLFDKIAFTKSPTSIFPNSFPKIYCQIETSILSTMKEQTDQLGSSQIKNSGNAIFFSRKVGYFLQVLNFEPSVKDRLGNKRPPSEFKSVFFSDTGKANSALCLLNSSLFYWFMTILSDCRHLNKREVEGIFVNLDALAKSKGKEMLDFSTKLMKDLQTNSEHRKMKFKHDELTIQCIFPKHSKPIIDAIDTLLASHYGFTPEELDFIINYDIKYRMGRGAGEE